MTNQTWLQFITFHFPELLIKLGQQIYLVGISTAIAILIGLPLGIIVTRVTKLKPPIIGFANIMQTIPSLALLALLIPFFGIGAVPAIIALSVYTLLPIVRNTLAGLESVPPATIEAARGIGLTAWQRLRIVELPLALPIIIAGIRTAAVISVGIATLAAFIGAGGLGDFINQGLTMNNTRLLLLGAIPAGLLALFIDHGIGYIEKRLQTRTRKRRTRSKRSSLVISLIVVLAVAITSGVIYVSCHNLKKNTIVIGTKNFTESIILGEMMSQLITAKTDLHVIKKFNLGATSICQSALLKGDIDIYPEYTGTGYLMVLNKKYPGNLSPEDVYQIVKQDYLKKFNLVWLSPFGFNNTQAIAVRETFAKKHHLVTMSDLKPIENQLTIAAPPEFDSRPDGYPGLRRVYGLKFANVKAMDIGLMYQALKNKVVNVGVVFSTDGRIIPYHLQILKDNKHLFPPYYAAPVARLAILEKYPQIKTALAPLAGILNDKTMQKLNYEVDIQKRAPAEVAHQFLVAKGLLQ